MNQDEGYRIAFLSEGIQLLLVKAESRVGTHINIPDIEKPLSPIEPHEP